ncbi:MAG: bifunctional (p)ppGpp synthetase/guanosine-3',5'-bis(diphosphate) 3'-pyrophosphohydrolase [Desulfobacteraceae bacterium]|nr:bifunctional (p)ppGpp synthetase/guanosine-3',5'-bis(diphosphate) 3'-pyrophosphohydrolase [Desulfobacteraceae bacterium]
MIRINNINDKVSENYPDADLDIIDRAYIYSARVHDGQVRLSGEPYLSHPLEVAYILANMNMDTVSIAAALLHDVIEDTHATPEEIKEIFGDEVFHIVSGVTKLSVITFNSSEERQAESIRRMLLAMADDIRVILIKLADRLHNMRTLQYQKEPKQKLIARETMDIYAPLAARLGIQWIKKELQDTSFKYLLPEDYTDIESRVNKDKEERENYVEQVKTIIRENLEKNTVKGEVLGRYKHFFSIHQKMLEQNLDFEDIYDIIAFRIILDTIPQCYEALGVVHSLWRPVPNKFKDYIGNPKPNMYRSLHTTVIGPKGERIEVQIRTREMDEVATSGIAAHWSYKEGASPDSDISKKFTWIKNIIENQENIQDPNEFLENVRIDLFPEDVYVFTPKGEVKSLPRGATPVDFAYLIHTEVGNQCVGAKVNGRMVPLKHELATGNIIEIVTVKNHHPSKDWLNFVKTVKARARIRQWIKTQDKERSLSLGREMCEKAFRKNNLNFTALVRSEKMIETMEHMNFKTVEDLIASVGYGKTTPLQIVRKFVTKETGEEAEDTILGKIIDKVRKKKVSSGVLVKGIDDILIKFGKCCRPVPGDEIIGYITQGFGVTIHRKTCVNALKTNPERQIEVDWDKKSTETFPVKVGIRSMDRVGLLADIAATISKNEANIQDVNTKTNEDKVVSIFLTLAVGDTHHLEKVLSSLRKVKYIQEAKRLDV